MFLQKIKRMCACADNPYMDGIHMHTQGEKQEKKYVYYTYILYRERE